MRGIVHDVDEVGKTLACKSTLSKATHRPSLGGRKLSTKDARKSTSVPGKPRNAVMSYPVVLRGARHRRTSKECYKYEVATEGTNNGSDQAGDRGVSR